MRTFGIVCKSGKEEEDERVKETKKLRFLLFLLFFRDLKSEGALKQILKGGVISLPYFLFAMF